MLGQETGCRISTYRMQYDTADIWKQTKKINAEKILEGTVLQNVDKI